MQPHNEAKKAASTFFDASFKLTLGNLVFDLVGSELDFISSILFGSISVSYTHLTLPTTPYV